MRAYPDPSALNPKTSGRCTAGISTAVLGSTQTAAGVDVAAVTVTVWVRMIVRVEPQPARTSATSSTTATRDRRAHLVCPVRRGRRMPVTQRQTIACDDHCRVRFIRRVVGHASDHVEPHPLTTASTSNAWHNRQAQWRLTSHSARRHSNAGSVPRTPDGGNGDERTSKLPIGATRGHPLPTLAGGAEARQPMSAQAHFHRAPAPGGPVGGRFAAVASRSSAWWCGRPLRGAFPPYFGAQARFSVG